jgi:hypothetical protein
VHFGTYIDVVFCSAAIGEIDEATDEQLDFDNIKADALKAVVH